MQQEQEADEHPLPLALPLSLLASWCMCPTLALPLHPPLHLCQGAHILDFVTYYLRELSDEDFNKVTVKSMKQAYGKEISRFNKKLFKKTVVEEHERCGQERVGLLHM